MNEQRIHRIFKVSVLLKGAHAVIECIDGLALALAQAAEHGQASTGRGWCRWSTHGSASERNCALGVHDLLDDGEQVEGDARQSVDPRYDQHVAGGRGQGLSSIRRS
jgi:hypothetical protein